MNDKEQYLVNLARQYWANSTAGTPSFPWFEMSKENDDQSHDEFLLELIETNARSLGHLLSEDDITSIQFDRLIFTLDVILNS